MEFRFTVANLFRTPIIRVNNTLLPVGFGGDRRSALDATARIAEILNSMGEASAKAQGLNKPVTTAQKLRNSDHIVYLLSEKSGKQNIVVTGLLKFGCKSLYIFDANGDTQMVNAPCLLDFYVHESRQRAGLGKQLFEAMLHEEGLPAEHLAIDRPSEKLIAFLKKHYGLTQIIPQMNNFVIYQGFFKNKLHQNGHDEKRLHLTSSPNTSLFGPQLIGEKRRIMHNQENLHNIPIIQTSPVGRYAAPRPTCSMAQIIHNSPTTTIPNEPQSILMDDEYMDEQSLSTKNNLGNGLDDELNSQMTEDNENNENMSELIKRIESTQLENSNTENNLVKNNHHNDEQEIDGIDEIDHDQQKSPTVHFNFSPHNHDKPEIQKPMDLNLKSERNFRHNKMHTGLKNLSFNVCAAVSPTNKMEFYQEKPECFGQVKITQPIGASPKAVANNADGSMSPTSSSDSETKHLTEQGFFDLKFYHNKLW